MGFAWPTNGFTPLVFFGLVPLLLIEDFIIRDNMGKKNSKTKSRRISYETIGSC